MLLLLFFVECTSSLLPRQHLASKSTITKKRYRLQRLFYAYICGIAISKSNDVTALPWDAVGWDGTIEIPVGWGGNRTRQCVPWTTLETPIKETLMYSTTKCILSNQSRVEIYAFKPTLIKSRTFG